MFAYCDDVFSPSCLMTFRSTWLQNWKKKIIFRYSFVQTTLFYKIYIYKKVM